MVITDLLERNARLYGAETALVEINPSEERDRAKTWREFSLIENTRPDLPYRREMNWSQFDKKANRFANLLLSRGIEKGQKVGILLMNCLEWLPVYFGALKAGAISAIRPTRSPTAPTLPTSRCWYLARNSPSACRLCSRSSAA